MIITIASRELRSLFLSPMAWVLLALVQGVSAYLFLSQLDFYIQIQGQLMGMDNTPGITQLVIAPLFANTAVLGLLLIPLLTMRTISEERRSQSLPLLMSAPVSMSEIILGKLFGLAGFIFTMVMLVTLMPLTLAFSNTLDYGIFFSAALGLLLILVSFAAAGVFISSLTAQPIVAAAGSFFFLLFLWIIDWSGNAGETSAITQVIQYLSILKHYEPMLRGVISSTDMIYYFLFIAGFVILTIRSLDNDRLQD